MIRGCVEHILCRHFASSMYASIYASELIQNGQLIPKEGYIRPTLKHLGLGAHKEFSNFNSQVLHFLFSAAGDYRLESRNRNTKP